MCSRDIFTFWFNSTSQSCEGLLLGLISVYSSSCVQVLWPFVSKQRFCLSPHKREGAFAQGYWRDSWQFVCSQSLLCVHVVYEAHGNVLLEPGQGFSAMYKNLIWFFCSIDRLDIIKRSVFSFNAICYLLSVCLVVWGNLLHIVSGVTLDSGHL